MPTQNFLEIFRISSNYFPLPITQESNRMAYMKPKNSDDDDDAMDNINDSELVSFADKESVDENLADEEAEALEEAWKERMKLMAA